MYIVIATTSYSEEEVRAGLPGNASGGSVGQDDRVFDDVVQSQAVLACFPRVAFRATLSLHLYFQRMKLTPSKSESSHANAKGSTAHRRHAKRREDGIDIIPRLSCPNTCGMGGRVVNDLVEPDHGDLHA
jgi:hypothetical protein